VIHGPGRSLAESAGGVARLLGEARATTRQLASALRSQARRPEYSAEERQVLLDMAEHVERALARLLAVPGVPGLPVSTTGTTPGGGIDG